MKLKVVNRWDPSQRKFRLFRLLWTRGRVGDGRGYSAKLSFAVRPMLFRNLYSFDGWEVTLFGVCAHYCRSYGGIMV